MAKLCFMASSKGWTPCGPTTCLHKSNRPPDMMVPRGKTIGCLLSFVPGLLNLKCSRSGSSSLREQGKAEARYYMTVLHVFTVKQKN